MGTFTNWTERDAALHNAKVSGNLQPPASGGVEKEKVLHADILAECRRRGWIAIHSRMDAPSTLLLGAPDFVILADNGRTFFIEAKTRTGKLSAAQLAVKAWAKRLNHEVHCVRSLEQFLEVVK